MHEDFWVPIVMFIMIGIVLCSWLYFRFRARIALQETVRSAIEKGHDLTPELLKHFGQVSSGPRADLRRGAIAVSLGIAFGVFAMILGERDAVRPLLATGAFPFLIGIAYLALWRFASDPEA